MAEKDHFLKVEEAGDPYKTGIYPSIRIKGKWLKRAGISPNSKVIVKNVGAGKLIIEVIECGTSLD